MASNSPEIIQEIQAKVLTIIEQMTGEAANNMTAYEAEKGVLSAMLSLGASCLSLFYQNQASQYMAKTAINAKGIDLPFHSMKQRHQMSLFGKIAITRAYYYRAGEGGSYPLDDAINLAPTLYSDVVQELYAELAVEQAYQSGNEFMQRWLNLSVSSRAVQAIVAESGAEVPAFYEQVAPPDPERQQSILVAQADGKGVPQIVATPAADAVRPKRGQARSRKKEAIVTTAYTIAPRPRTLAATIASLFNGSDQVYDSDTTSSSVQPIDKMLWATLEGKPTAMQQLQSRVAEREHPKVQYRIALCDGAKPLQEQFMTLFPDFRLVLDFIHAYEYLWKAANLLFKEDDPQRLTWVKSQTTHLLDSATASVIDHLRERADPLSGRVAERLHKIANYFERNSPFMDYATCLQLGLPIASGVIEGACRHIVKDRMELSGMRWSRNGAETLLQLRCVRHNGHWDDFWHYHRSLRQTVRSGTHISSLPLAG